jgi:hypothetical protein
MRRVLLKMTTCSLRGIYCPLEAFLIEIGKNLKQIKGWEWVLPANSERRNE